jgi:hypothetical protein
MKKWLVPAIVCAFALSLFEMWVTPLSPYEIELRGALPPEQEKAAIRLAQLPSLTLLNLVPGINFFFIYARFYHQAIQKQSPLSGRIAKADEAARSAAGTVTLISFLIWLFVWITVALIRPKWWYVAVAFALTVGAAVWISQLPDSSLPG